MGASQVEDQAGGGKGAVLKRFSSFLEPVTAVGDPPARKSYGDCGGQRPPEWKSEICEQAERGEGDPEDFAFHTIILFWRLPSAAEAAFLK
jgi:hypothetical protein